MNAVKRCLALFAATLVVGACSGDPTADEAGANLTIRATPGAVWVRNDKTATVLLEAIDGTGGTQPGSWTVSTIVGPIVVTLDTAFQNTNSGPLGNGQQFIISSTLEGEGFVVFSGTGGVDTVRVRIAPADAAFHVTANDSSPVLFQPITLTAPAGIVFTGATTVRFFNGPLASDTSNGGLSFPSIISRSADSSQITFVPGPGARGFARISGIASRSTPTLVSTAQTVFQFGQVPTVDTLTAGFNVTPAFRATGTRVTASFLDTLVLTAPANYVFLPTTTIEFFRIVSGNYTVANGTAAPKRVGLNADSSQIRFLVAPGARGRLKIRNIAFRIAPEINFRIRDITTNTFDQRSGIAGAPDTANIAWTFSKTSPIAEGDSVTATAPTGWVFLPGVASVNAGSAAAPSGGDSARIVLTVKVGTDSLISADSTKVTFRLPPGASGKFRYANVARRADPTIVWQARGAAISAAAAPPVVATMSPTTGNMNDTITIALDPAGPYRYRPASNAELGGLPAAFARVSADSLSLKVLPTPGQTGQLTLTNIRYGALPTFQVRALTASSLTVNAPFSVGPDDPANSAVFAAPTVAGTSNAKGWWDALTMTDSDPSPDCDGGVGAQFYTLTVGAAGSYTITVNWLGTVGDIDFGVMVKDGGYDGGGSCSDYLSTAGLSGAKPERNSALTLAVGTYVIGIIDFDGDFAAGDVVSVNVVKN